MLKHQELVQEGTLVRKSKLFFSMPSFDKKKPGNKISIIYSTAFAHLRNFGNDFGEAYSTACIENCMLLPQKSRGLPILKIDIFPRSLVAQENASCSVYTVSLLTTCVYITTKRHISTYRNCDLSLSDEISKYGDFDMSKSDAWTKSAAISQYSTPSSYYGFLSFR